MEELTIVFSKLTATTDSQGSIETSLLTGLRKGEQKSIELLYKTYAPALYTIISRIVKIEEIAEDVLQETFLKIWKNIDQYDCSKGKLFTWMVNLAKNTAIDQIRSKHYRNSNQTDVIDDTCLLQKRQHHIHINLDLIGMKQLTENLSPNQKRIIDLFYYEGYTQAEVAEALAIPLGTVKTKIRQAIISLRQYFNETCQKQIRA